mgnify:CR=1 FL=1
MNKKLKIGYIFESVQEDGGNFQTELTTALRLRKTENENIKVKFFTNNKKNLEILKSYDFKPILIKTKNLNLFVLILNKYIHNKKIINFFNFFFQINRLEKQLLDEKIDIVHFNGMSSLSLQLKEINFGVSFWDAGHLIFPQFPESRNNYHSFESREYIYNLLLKKSAYVITDCLENKKFLIKTYNVHEDKISIIYSEPATELLNIDKDNNLSREDIYKNFNIKYKEFIFYPAQYWPHKNHIYIMEAISILKKKYNRNISVVFTGKNKFGNLNYIKKCAVDLDIVDNITFENFVDSKSLFYLYKYSIAIVVPTYMGPTNHLPIEGFFVGTPVIYSDLWSKTEQVEGAVISTDLNDPNSLSLNIIDLLDNNDLSKMMVKRGKEKYIQLLARVNENHKIYQNIFNAFFVIRKNWDKNE